MATRQLVLNVRQDFKCGLAATGHHTMSTSTSRSKKDVMLYQVSQVSEQ